MAGVQKINPASESPITTTDSRPVPDPTSLTTQQLNAAVGGLREVFEVRLAAMDRAVDILQTTANKSPTIGEVYAKHEERFVASERLIKDATAKLDTRHSEIIHEVTHLRELLSERFNTVRATISGMDEVGDQRFARIDGQFTERDKRTDQLSLADKTAVAAALQAAKEAVGAQNTSNSIAIAKSESSTVESIRQLQTLFNSAIAAVNDKLNDVRSRIDRGDGNTSGQSIAHIGNREERTDSRSLVFSLVSAGLALSALLVTVIFHFK